MAGRGTIEGKTAKKGGAIRIFLLMSDEMMLEEISGMEEESS